MADLLESSNVFYGYFLPRKHQGCKGCYKDIQDGFTDNKDSHRRATDEIRKSYGYQLYIYPHSLCRKFKQFDFSVASPQTAGILGGSHKDIRDVTDGRMGGKDDP